MGCDVNVVLFYHSIYSEATFERSWMSDHVAKHELQAQHGLQDELHSHRWWQQVAITSPINISADCQIWRDKFDTYDRQNTHGWTACQAWHDKHGMPSMA